MSYSLTEAKNDVCNRAGVTDCGTIIDMNHVLTLTDPVLLTQQLIDIPSESRSEKSIADAVEAALTGLGLETVRVSNTVAARTSRGLGRRVILAGHFDTVPAAGNIPSHRDGDIIHGLGSVDMKSGDACFLHVLATLARHESLNADITAIFYECEEIAAQFSGLQKFIDAYPEWVRGDFAILGEPTGGVVEAGCQGTIRMKLTAHGVRAHSARAWLGENALHKLGPILTRIAADEPREVDIDGCTYKEGFNAVAAEAGVAKNTIPDEAVLYVNFRYAPDRSVEDAKKHMLTVLGGGDPARAGELVDIDYDDVSPAAAPGLSTPVAADFVALAGSVRAKYGWTDVARLSALGIPSVNCGPGDPSLCHKPEEHCPVSQIEEVSALLTKFLTC